MNELHKIKAKKLTDALDRSLNTYCNKIGWGTDEQKKSVKLMIQYQKDDLAKSVESSERMKATNRKIKADKHALNLDLFSDK